MDLAQTDLALGPRLRARDHERRRWHGYYCHGQHAIDQRAVREETGQRRVIVRAKQVQQEPEQQLLKETRPLSFQTA